MTREEKRAEYSIRILQGILSGQHHFSGYQNSEMVDDAVELADLLIDKLEDVQKTVNDNYNASKQVHLRDFDAPAEYEPEGDEFF